MITDKDLLKLENRLLQNLSAFYCLNPGRFETDLQGDDKYNSGWVKEAIHDTLKVWAETQHHDKAYVVTSGEYSDYDINAVFLSKNKANKYCNNFRCNNVEEYGINPGTTPVHVTTVWMGKDGRVLNTHLAIYDSNYQYKDYWCYTTSGPWDGKKTVVSMEVKTPDETRAIKVVNEKRVQILAFGYWGDAERTKELFNR